MLEYYIYLGLVTLCAVTLGGVLIGVVINASNIAINNMSHEGDILLNQYNDVVEFIHVHEMSKESAEAILMYLNAIDSRLTMLSLKANSTEVSRKNYNEAIKKFNVLIKNITKTREYIMTRYM